MKTLLVISIIIIILLLISISLLVSIYYQEKAKALYYHVEWAKWETRWYNAQALISKDLGYHLSPDGLRTSMTITKHKN